MRNITFCVSVIVKWYLHNDISNFNPATVMAHGLWCRMRSNFNNCKDFYALSYCYHTLQWAGLVETFRIMYPGLALNLDLWCVWFLFTPGSWAFFDVSGFYLLQSPECSSMCLVSIYSRLLSVLWCVWFLFTPGSWVFFDVSGFYLLLSVLWCVWFLFTPGSWVLLHSTCWLVCYIKELCCMLRARNRYQTSVSGRTLGTFKL